MCKGVVDVRVLVEDDAIWNLGVKLLGDAYMSVCQFIYSFELRREGPHQCDSHQSPI
jgi:hypothetical protein